MDLKLNSTIDPFKSQLSTLLMDLKLNSPRSTPHPKTLTPQDPPLLLQDCQLPTDSSLFLQVYTGLKVKLPN